MELRDAAALCALAIAALACHTGVDVACTTEFRVFGVQVLDHNRMPATGLQPEATILRTGQRTMTVDSLRQLARGGWYPIVSDYDLGALQPSGDSIRLLVASGQARATATYFFDIPGPGRCHVRKVWGPDTVFLLTPRVSGGA